MFIQICDDTADPALAGHFLCSFQKHNRPAGGFSGKGSRKCRLWRVHQRFHSLLCSLSIIDETRLLSLMCCHRKSSLSKATLALTTVASLYSSALQLQSELISSPNILHGLENNALINKSNVILCAVSKPFMDHSVMLSEHKTACDAELMDRMSQSN